MEKMSDWRKIKGKIERNEQSKTIQKMHSRQRMEGEGWKEKDVRLVKGKEHEKGGKEI